MPKYLATAVLILGALNAPLIPENMELQYSYQYHADGYKATLEIVHPSSSSSTPDTITYEPNPQPEFKDDNADGIISVSVFKDQNGNTVYMQIPEAKYMDMGKKNGASTGINANPTKTELKSMLDLMAAQPAEAAIAFDTSSQAGAWNGSQSSVTWAHTNTGSDRGLVVGVTSYNKKTTGATYNGATMDYTSFQDQGTTLRLSAFYLKNPSAGANNVVVSLSGNDYVRTSAMSFTGTDQTTNPQTFQNHPYNASDPSTITETITTTGTTFLAWITYSNSTPTAGTDTTRQQTANEHTVYTSSTSRSPGSNSVQSLNNGAFHSILLVIQETPPAVPSPSADDAVIFE